MRILIALCLWLPSFAHAQDNWCHARSVDPLSPHEPVNIHLDYQVRDYGQNYRADPLWINLELDRDANKLTGAAPYGVFLGIGRGPEWEICQTLEIRSGSVNGPSERHNFNLSRSYDEVSRGACFQR